MLKLLQDLQQFRWHEPHHVPRRPATGRVARPRRHGQRRLPAQRPGDGPVADRGHRAQRRGRLLRPIRCRSPRRNISIRTTRSSMEGMNVRCHYNQDGALSRGALRQRPQGAAAGQREPGDLRRHRRRAPGSRRPRRADEDRLRQPVGPRQLLQEHPQRSAHAGGGQQPGHADPSDDKLTHSCVLDMTAAASNKGQFGAADPPHPHRARSRRASARTASCSRSARRTTAPRSTRSSRSSPSSSARCACRARWFATRAAWSAATWCGSSRRPAWLRAAPRPFATRRASTFCSTRRRAARPRPTRRCDLPRGADGGHGRRERQEGYVPTMTDGTTYSDGWYYDDFSDDVKKGCTGTDKQRVAFTNMAKPPTGVTVKLECLNETQSLANTRTDVAPNIDQPAIGSACEMVVSTARLRWAMRVLVRLSAPSEAWPDGNDKSMFCHPQLNVCVRSCNTDANCPAAWVCDYRPDTLAATSRKNNPRNGLPSA